MSVTLSPDSLETSCNSNILNNATHITDAVNILSNELFTKSWYSRSSFKHDFCNLSDDVDVDPNRFENDNEIDVDEAINVSQLGSTSLKSIDTKFETGNDRDRVYSHESFVAEYTLSISATSTGIISNTYDTSSPIAIHSYTDSFSDWVESFESDCYKFNLEFTGNLQLELNDLSANADVELQDINGISLGSSKGAGNTDKAKATKLSPGTYYVRVYADTNSSKTYYTLSISATPLNEDTSPIPTSSASNTQSNPTASSNPPTPATAVTSQTSSNGTRIVRGDLGANTFIYESSPGISVFLGNGNVDFGSGQRDSLHLSNISFTTVSLKLANTSGGGVLYNPGNGTRLFDGIELSDGRQILFEGIDCVVFTDKELNLSVEPNDPMFSKQWNLHMMDVQDAWRFTQGNSNVLVGVQDTGLPVLNGNTHLDLGVTTYIPNNYVDEMSTSGVTTHGLSTQSVINAQINNGVGMSGVGNFEVFHIDVLGGDAHDSTLVDATQEMIRKANTENRRLVINFSLTGGYSTLLEQLVVNNQNVLFVFASGNTGADTLTEPAILAQYKNAIAVGASWGRKDYYGNPKNLGERISYINWWSSNGGTELTIMAPGEVIAANGTQQSTSSAFEFGFNSNFNGTSAAVPHVTGIAGLLWSVNKNLSAFQIKEILSQTAYDLGTPGHDKYYGHGFVNAGAAVRRALAIGMGA
ncbi:S8 family serine peptidase [Scytonema sp. UIC 10036]|uniref:S8 family serine peptidase n=1 Tax=Scytonema sp. UIC 10036 TaxID=2304196 RepID=UPI0012DA981B|nr:S8 family serine peptidase [Scytonema sp. UIC 10036]MUG91815.1 S8 family serine peptidase [Scytonema sp. UIC 10036]